MKYRNKNKGFTLIEIIVALVILGMILAIIPLLLPNVIASTETKAAVRELAAGLRYARSQSITKQKETMLILNVEKKFYQIDKQQKKLKLPDDTQLTLITARSEQHSQDQASIRFFPDGSSTGGRIKLGNDNKMYTIDINWLTGKIKISP